MRKRYWLAVIAMTIGAAGGTAVAADIGNLSGQSCGDLTGTWHFVNNQVPRGSGDGTLMASWDSGDMCSIGPYATSNKVRHFECMASGMLESASTDLGGKLVLSDFSCEDKEPPCEKDCEPPPCEKDCEPPPCDDKDPKCEPPK
jgi:hypothetical protein